MSRADRLSARRRQATAIALVAVLVALVGLLSDSDADEPGVPPGALALTIASRPTGSPVAPGFIGLSIEYRSAPAYFGTDPSAPDPVFTALVKGLTPGQSPVLRFGGDTSDWTWWPTAGVRISPGLRYALTPGWAQSTAAAARALGAKLILGVNLEADSSRLAGVEARSLEQIIGAPAIAGFELGNEPEVYGALGWYTRSSGAEVLGRRPSYGFDAYLRDYARIRRALPRGVPLIGPASGAPAWLSGLPRYLKSEPGVGLVTYHRYPLHRCFTPRNSPDYPTIANLLAPVASSGPATSLAGAIAAAHARGLELRVDELNSVSCGGARGVSDTFASALWALDTLFNMARAGVAGVNIHTFHNAIYAPFAVHHVDGEWSARVRPLYYGLLAFARAAPAGSRLLSTTMSHPPSTLRTWATLAPDGSEHAVLINDSPRRQVTVAVHLGRQTTTASIQRLEAPRLNSRSDVSLAGQSFGDSTSTGQLSGPDATASLAPAQGALVVRVPPGTAAILTVPVR